MKAEGMVVLVIASLTLSCFGAAMAWFRKAGKATPAKVGLTLSALLCAAIQLTIIVRVHHTPLLYRVLGIGLYLLAHVLFWWARAAHCGKRPDFAFLNREPTFLTQSGPYRMIRHPIYTAYLLVWLAGAVVTAQSWLLLTVLWMTLLHYLAARQEERLFSRTAFADDYAGYQRQTGMFLPRLIGWRQAG
jgi:protein-S-isoprenylcysteine O-methyltransferase Ste14